MRRWDCLGKKVNYVIKIIYPGFFVFMMTWKSDFELLRKLAAYIEIKFTDYLHCQWEY